MVPSDGQSDSFAFPFGFKQLAWTQGTEAAIEELGGRHKEQRSKIENCLAVGSLINARHLAQRVNLAREHQLACRGRIEQRFDAKSVAQQQQLPPSRVIDGHGKHAPKLFNHLGAVLLVKMRENLRV